MRCEKSGVIQAIHVPGLVRWARERDCVLVLHHPVGDFVTTGVALFEVYGRDAVPADRRALQGMLALGVERTIEHDPGFAIRIMVDIANRALSAAVNDPTTAVQVLDHLEETLTPDRPHAGSGAGSGRSATRPTTCGCSSRRRPGRTTSR